MDFKRSSSNNEIINQLFWGIQRGEEKLSFPTPKNKFPQLT